MSNVIGIDADRQRLAVAFFINGKRRTETIERVGKRGQLLPNYFEDRKYMLLTARDYKASVYLEGIYLPRVGSHNTNVETYRMLAHVQGGLVEEAARLEVDIEIVPPTSWQSRMLGITRGRPKIKAASRALAESVVGPGLTEHEADAVCICLYGERLLEEREAG